MRTGNPVLSDRTFESYEFEIRESSQAMTLQGTVNKTAILLVLTVVAAAFAWQHGASNPGSLHAMLIGGSLGGLVLALIISFKANLAPALAPIYAIVKGVAVGAISMLYNAQFDGIVLQAALLTFGVLFALLTAYRSGLIKATENFKLGLVAATGGVLLVYLATLVLGLFNIQIPYIHDSGMIGIGFSVFVVIIAALNLVLDFDFIENGAANGAPKYMEWYGAFGLMVTLIWLYLEILRLLAKLASNKD